MDFPDCSSVIFVAFWLSTYSIHRRIHVCNNIWCFCGNGIKITSKKVFLICFSGLHRVDIDTNMEDIKELLRERGMKIVVPCIPAEEIDKEVDYILSQ